MAGREGDAGDRRPPLGRTTGHQPRRGVAFLSHSDADVGGGSTAAATAPPRHPRRRRRRRSPVIGARDAARPRRVKHGGRHPRGSDLRDRHKHVHGRRRVAVIAAVPPPAPPVAPTRDASGGSPPRPHELRRVVDVRDGGFPTPPPASNAGALPTAAARLADVSYPASMPAARRRQASPSTRSGGTPPPHPTRRPNTPTAKPLSWQRYGWQPRRPAA